MGYSRFNSILWDQRLFNIVCLCGFSLHKITLCYLALGCPFPDVSFCYQGWRSLLIFCFYRLKPIQLKRKKAMCCRSARTKSMIRKDNRSDGDGAKQKTEGVLIKTAGFYFVGNNPFSFQLNNLQMKRKLLSLPL